ncbi:MAG: glycosyltransferase family 2 protein [Chloroflexi bacterium]|nr:glycosyltransferase family 2 protein [Chloroflexota bacterium]
MVIRAPFGEHLVDVSVVSWNSWGHLRRNLPALIDQDYPSYRVVVVDNDSSDETAEHVEAEFPDVDVVRCGRNGGYGAANNLGFARSQSKYVAVVNPDARPERGWLRSLVRALEQNPNAALATSKVLLASDSSRVNACGNIVHLSGIAFCRGLDDDQHQYVRGESVPAVSGAAFIARRDALEQIGGFDERFFMYMEDTELSLRARLAGWDVILAPRSRVIHDYQLDIPASKFYYLERNRFFMLANIFRLPTLVALMPALAVAELGVWWFALRTGRGLARAKFASYVAVVAGLPAILRQRRRVQAVRRVSDARLLACLNPNLPSGVGETYGLTRIANAFFRGYNTLMRRLVRW